MIEAEKEPDKWALTEELRYDRPPCRSRTEVETYVVSLPFLTDFASIPSAFAWAVPRYGQHTKAAIVHDCLCTSEIDRFTADEVFRDALKESGVSPGRRWLLWTGVTWGSVHSALRAVVKGKRRDPVALDRVPARTSLPEAGATTNGATDTGDDAAEPVPAGDANEAAAGAGLSRIRAAVVLIISVAGCLALLNWTLAPADWLSWPDYSRWWQWLSVAAGLLALVMAALLLMTAIALWRSELIVGGKLPGAWLVSVGVMPFIPIALGAGILMFVYTLGKLLRRFVKRGLAQDISTDLI